MHAQCIEHMKMGARSQSKRAAMGLDHNRLIAPAHHGLHSPLRRRSVGRAVGHHDASAVTIRVDIIEPHMDVTDGSIEAGQRREHIAEQLRMKRCAH